MVDEDHDRVAVLGDPRDHVPEVRRLLVGQAGGRLVEQHHARLTDERAGDLDQPAIARAERPDPCLRVGLEPDERDRVEHVLAARADGAFECSWASATLS